MRKRWIVAIIIGCIVVIAFIFIGYWFDWTGFNGYNKVTVAHTISGPNTGAVIQTEEYQPGKALWDWLQLLIIPVVLAIGGFWFNQIQKRREEKTTELRAQNEREIALDKQREDALQAYLDHMSELLLNKDEHLRTSTPDTERRQIARSRTLIVLRSLDGVRKGIVLQFLHESRLIIKGLGGSIINLENADLSNIEWKGGSLDYADLSGADLSKAKLSYANLTKADLTRAKLHKADLSHANLSNAQLRLAQLKEAQLCSALLTDEVNLREADLSDANLYNADLEKAALRAADLSKAILKEANLVNANLGGATVEQWQLDEAKSLQGATMPDGTIHP